MKKSKKVCCMPVSELANAHYNRIESALQELIPLGQAIRYTDGQVLFYKEHTPFGFFLLQAGSVALGHQLVSRTADEAAPSAGHLLGLVHLLNGAPYMATCCAVGAVDVLFFPKILITRFLEEPGYL